jgi:hypothetical protein
MFPVYPNSATTWNREQDTYNACRSGCSRRHQGEDLMAPKMTKLLAVKAGVVVELRHRSGGNSLYIRGDDGWFYCYLHINNDSPGTDNAANRVEHTWGPGLRKFATSATAMNEAGARGYRVKEGELVAYCGDSGNAEGTGPHLHFEIRKPASGSYSSETSRLWASASVNPRESLRAAKPARLASSMPPETFRPFTSAEAFVTYQFQDFFDRNPSAADLSYYGGMLDAGTKSPDWLMQLFLDSDESDGLNQSIVRLYRAFYRRLPENDGLVYWMGARRDGWSLFKMAEQFARTPEFTEMYGPLTNEQYVNLVYNNVLGRAPDPDGKAYWLGELNSGRQTRGRMMVGFSEGAEYKAKQRTPADVYGCYGVMFGRAPSASELSAWSDVIEDSGSTGSMVTMLHNSSEYAETAT